MLGTVSSVLSRMHEDIMNEQFASINLLILNYRSRAYIIQTFQRIGSTALLSHRECIEI